MLAIFLRQDYPELAKVVHSLSGTVTTIFLFTRLWARATKYQGLWWDDYILIAAWACQLVGNGLAAASPVYGFNVQTGTTQGQILQFAGACFFYAAIGLSKIAFTTTLLRLSPRRSMGPTRAALWAVLAAVGAFTAALVVVTWLPLCAFTYETISLPSLGVNKGSLADGSGSSGSGSGSSCVSPKTSVWTHTAYALCMLAADAVLVALPWRIVRGIRTIPERERCKVALTMNLVGVAALVEAARIALSLELPYNDHDSGIDYTYGIIAIYCLVQAEAATFIVAQTIPILRITLQKQSASSRLVSSVAEPTYSRQGGGDSNNSDRNAARLGASMQDRHEDVELVQLPTGRIVPATSAEGLALRASQEEAATAAERSPVASKMLPSGEPQRSRARSTVGSGDEIHRLWADMGLSKRVWSRSPSPVRPAQGH